MAGPREMRPRLGLSPTSPQQAAGTRSEPPPSLPWPSGTIPAATATAEPPDDPPGVRVGSHGLRVGPVWRGSVVGRMPNSDMFVTPTTTQPPAFRRRTGEALYSGPRADKRREPNSMHRPAAGVFALMATGTPANGRLSPRVKSPAASSARSPSTSTNALSAGLSASMRSSDAETTSRDERWPERTSDASSPAVRNIRSSDDAMEGAAYGTERLRAALHRSQWPDPSPTECFELPTQP